MNALKNSPMRRRRPGRMAASGADAWEAAAGFDPQASWVRVDLGGSFWILVDLGWSLGGSWWIFVGS